MVQRAIRDLPRHAGAGCIPVELSWSQAQPVGDGGGRGQRRQAGNLRQPWPRGHGRAKPEHPFRPVSCTSPGASVSKECCQSLLGQLRGAARKDGKDAANKKQKFPRTTAASLNAPADQRRPRPGAVKEGASEVDREGIGGRHGKNGRGVPTRLVMRGPSIREGGSWVALRPALGEPLPQGNPGENERKNSRPSLDRLETHPPAS
jgi:hypothetical protein